jgi:hypothetical protein
MHNKSIERLGRDVEQSSHSATIAIVLTQQKRKQHKKLPLQVRDRRQRIGISNETNVAASH